MRLDRLLHLTVLVLATSAAPLTKRQDIHITTLTHELAISPPDHPDPLDQHNDRHLPKAYNPTAHDSSVALEERGRVGKTINKASTKKKKKKPTISKSNLRPDNSQTKSGIKTNPNSKPKTKSKSITPKPKTTTKTDNSKTTSKTGSTTNSETNADVNSDTTRQDTAVTTTPAITTDDRAPTDDTARTDDAARTDDTTRPYRNIFPILSEFAMPTTFKLAKPPAKGTNNLSANGAKPLPKQLTMTEGTFDPLRILENDKRLTVNANGFDRVSRTVKSSQDCPECKRPASGENGLSHVLAAYLINPVNTILDVVGSAGQWGAKGRGGAPMEDWNYDEGPRTRVVLELKTTDSLPTAHVDTIMTYVKGDVFRMAMVDDEKAEVKINSLVADGDDPLMRSTRKPLVLAVEQILAEMFNTGSRIGALTNAEDWIVFQRPGNDDDDNDDDNDDKVKEITASRVSGTNGGKSNALNILLAMALSV